MSTEVPSPCRSENEWVLLSDHHDSEEDRLEATGSPSPSLEAASEHEELLAGLASPESERLADDVLREPFQATALSASQPALQEALSLALQQPSAAAAAAAAVAAFAASTPHPSRTQSPSDTLSSCSWGFDRDRVKHASRLSGEGALEGFQDPPDLMLAAGGALVNQLGPSAASPAPARAASLQLDEQLDESEEEDEEVGLAAEEAQLSWNDLVHGVWKDLSAELHELRRLLSTAAGAVAEGAKEGGSAVAEWAADCQQAAQQAYARVSKALGAAAPLWLLLSVSGLAVVAVAALTGQVLVNRRMAVMLRQREKDLARMVVKILNLQDALHARSVGPVLRHAAALDNYTAGATALIGMGL